MSAAFEWGSKLDSNYWRPSRLRVSCGSGRLPLNRAVKKAIAEGVGLNCWSKCAREEPVVHWVGLLNGSLHAEDAEELEKYCWAAGIDQSFCGDVKNL